MRFAMAPDSNFKCMFSKSRHGLQYSEDKAPSSRPHLCLARQKRQDGLRQEQQSDKDLFEDASISSTSFALDQTLSRAFMIHKMFIQS